MPSAPFVVGQWVRANRFYGRAALIDEILAGPRNWVWLLGTRRIGKTSLLKQLEFLASTSSDPSYFPLFWDFQGAEDQDELLRGFRDALLDAQERLERLGIDEAELESTDLFDLLGRLRRKLRGAGLRLLLLCDEVEELIHLHEREPRLLRKLRRAMQSQEDIRSVMASTIRLWALSEERTETSPFLHGFTPPLYIQRLEDDEARALIRQANLPTDSQPGFDEEIVEQIRIRCDSHPYLIQLVCKRYLDLRNLDEAIEQVAADQMVSHFFSVDFEMLSGIEKDVIRIIAEASSANSDSIQAMVSPQAGAITGILFRLEALGYIRRNIEGRFELVNFFFRRWFRGQRPSPRSHLGVPPGLPGASPADLTTDQGDGIAPSRWNGRYQLLEELGEGATGVVYKAFDEVLRGIIAIKVLRPEYCASSAALERFRLEVLLARDIGHPNIVSTYHLGDCQGRKYLAMKWVEGSTLATMLGHEGPLPIARTVWIGRKLTSALEAAHALKVVHRDIKPQNILIDGHGEPFLTDFGLARLLSDPGRTRAGLFLGTPDYASPEQARSLPVDERSDLYSLGVVIFEMATGRKPFRSDSAVDVLEMHRSTPPPDPRTLRPELPPTLGKVILRSLDKDPARRYQSAGQLRLALEGVTLD